MSRVCQITGKRAMGGNNVSHSNRKTKRLFDVNLFNKKFYYTEFLAAVRSTMRQPSRAIS